MMLGAETALSIKWLGYGLEFWLPPSFMWSW